MGPAIISNKRDVNYDSLWRLLSWQKINNGTSEKENNNQSLPNKRYIICWRGIVDQRVKLEVIN